MPSNAQKKVMQTAVNPTRH